MEGGKVVGTGIATVITCIRVVQDPISQHFGMNRTGTHKVMSPGEGLLAIDSCRRKRKLILSGVRLLIVCQCSGE